MILKEFEKVDYLGTRIADIFRPLSFYSSEIDSAFVYNQYTLRGNQQSETLAYALGGNPELSWINLHINGVVDPFWGWVNNENDIRKLAIRRYDNADSVHHYIDPQTNDEWYDLVEEPTNSAQYYDIGDTTFTRIVFTGLLIPITNYEYEIEINEGKRNINLLPSQSFLSYDSSMKQVIEGSVDVDQE
tara:strand:+ start:688 stop:1251 length:564 start_codon:yes stop_codon:yes gene_type:complete